MIIFFAFSFDNGILADYLSVTRQYMLDYEHGGDGCERLFNLSKSAFACSSPAHFGDTSDVFIQYDQLWQRVQKDF
jgi:hypothetical protein